VLSENYTTSELRDARRNIGTDLDQYSDCRDILSAAELGADGSGGGDGGDGEESRGGGGAAGGAAGGGAGAGGVDAGPVATPAPPTPEEQVALDNMRTAPPPVTSVGGRPVALGPGTTVDADPHPIPLPLAVALGCLVAGGLAASVPAVRRHVPSRRPAA
jgi:hypothetical protein